MRLQDQYSHLKASDEQRPQQLQALTVEIPKRPQSHRRRLPVARISSFLKAILIWCFFLSVALTTCSKLDIVTVFSGGLKKRKEGQLSRRLRQTNPRRRFGFPVLLGLVVPRMLGASGRDTD